MIYKLRCIDDNYIAIPKVVISNFIRMASGDQLKVLLFIIENQKHSLTPESIAFNTSLSTEIVSEAIEFWEKVNILTESADEPPLFSGNSTTELFNSIDEFLKFIVEQFGFPNRLYPKDEETIKSWFSKGYSLELISYAYAETIFRINKANINYIDKILTSWTDENMIFVDDVRKFEKKEKQEKKAEILRSLLDKS